MNKLSQNPTLKRLFDLTLAIPSLILCAPIMLGIAILVRIYLGSPVIFRQMRPGLHGKLFTIYKFRTMNDTIGPDGKLLSDEKRLTKFGRFLRAWSLDELPELFNVILGDMSLVGPRPLLVEYLDRYTEEQARRHEVKPGITGWAQVNGRNALSWEDKFRLDLWYVDNWSPILDIKILLLTVIKVFRREGISQEGRATADKFMGSESNEK